MLYGGERLTTPPEQLDHLLSGLDADELATPFATRARAWDWEFVGICAMFFVAFLVAFFLAAGGHDWEALVTAIYGVLITMFADPSVSVMEVPS